MLLTRAKFELTNLRTKYIILWDRVGNKWNIFGSYMLSPPDTSYPDRWQPFNGIKEVSIFICANPTVEKSIEIIGQLENPQPETKK